MWSVLSRPLSTFWVSLGLIMIWLNLMDVALTLCNVSRGAVELNPLMASLLENGPVQFVLVKHSLMSVAVLGLAGWAEHCRRRFLAVFAVYVLIVAYQAVLLVLNA